MQNQAKMCLVTWLSKENYKNKEFAFVLLTEDKIDALNQTIESLRDYNLQDFGLVIETGFGKPNKELVEKVNKVYGCDFDVE